MILTAMSPGTLRPSGFLVLCVTNMPVDPLLHLARETE
jgi:hypothetical protein